ncbi:MAG: hypothetical protein JO182_22130 [Acidobacteriaceae bacterium]|nr:hypothetical protein [Acidobacteriaceae bacterium]
MCPLLEQAIGVLLLLLILLDIFLTVLYARIGTGIISDALTRLAWQFFLFFSKPFRQRRAHILSFCGPVIVVVLVGIWALGLTCGTALIIHPKLGTAIRASTGATPTDFITALYTGGSSISVVGSSDLAPQTSGFRLFYLLNSVIGMSVVSLTLTYLMQIYTALQQRNALGLKIHLMTSSTDDAAVLIAGLGPQGQFNSGYSNLADWSAEMAQVKELHHFYPVLFYFRFCEPYYSVSMSVLMAFDTVTLLKTGLRDEPYGWLKSSASVSQLWHAALLLVRTLEDTFLPGGSPDEPQPPDGPTQERWRRRYFAALQRLQQGGIHTITNEQAGAAAYVSLRTQWDTYITKLAPTLAYSMSEIDRAGSQPAATDQRKFAHI